MLERRQQKHAIDFLVFKIHDLQISISAPGKNAVDMSLSYPRRETRQNLHILGRNRYYWQL